MTFDEVLDQVRELLQQRGRVTYRSLKRRFDLDDEYVEELKGELIRAEGVAADEDGDVLIWTGAAPVPGSPGRVPHPHPQRPTRRHTWPSVSAPNKQRWNHAAAPTVNVRRSALSQS